MKQTLLALMSIWLAVPAFAATQPSVKASLYRIDFNLRLYEICGVASGVTNPATVDITVDGGTKFEGHYVTSSNGNGSFCQVIRVFGNAVAVDVLGQTQQLVTTQAVAR